MVHESHSSLRTGVSALSLRCSYFIFRANKLYDTQAFVSKNNFFVNLIFFMRNGPPVHF